MPLIDLSEVVREAAERPPKYLPELLDKACLCGEAVLIDSLDLWATNARFPKVNGKVREKKEHN